VLDRQSTAIVVTNAFISYPCAVEPISHPSALHVAVGQRCGLVDTALVWLKIFGARPDEPLQPPSGDWQQSIGATPKWGRLSFNSFHAFSPTTISLSRTAATRLGTPAQSASGARPAGFPPWPLPVQAAHLGEQLSAVPFGVRVGYASAMEDSAQPSPPDQPSQQSEGKPDVTSAGVPWNEVPEFARRDVAWIDGRYEKSALLPPVDAVPVPDILYELPPLHEDRPRGSKSMLDAAGARARLRHERPGAWLISPFSGWKWAKWPNGEVGWLPADIEMPASLRVET